MYLSSLLILLIEEKRGDIKEDTKRTYLKLKEKFYEPISQTRQQELLASLKANQQRMVTPISDEDDEKVLF